MATIDAAVNVIKSGFYYSENGDRVYGPDDISGLFEGLINDGVYDSIYDQFAVKPAEDQTEAPAIIVGTGRAFLNKKWVYNDAPVRFEFNDLAGISPEYARTDAIYIKIATNGTANRKTYISRASGDVFSIRDSSGSLIENYTGMNPPKLTDDPIGGFFFHVIAYVTITSANEGGRGNAITASDIKTRVGIKPAEGEDANSAIDYVNALVDHADIETINQDGRARWDNAIKEIVKTFNDKVKTLDTKIAQAELGLNAQVKNYQLIDVVVNDGEWVDESSDGGIPTYENYPFVYDINDINITSYDTPLIFFSAEDIAAGLMAPFAETFAGHLRIYSSDVPEHKDGVMTIPNIILIKNSAEVVE